MLAKLRSYWRWLRSEGLQREMEAEMRFHLEAREEDLAAGGMSRDQARRQARLEFGSAVTAQEEGRAARGLWLIDETVRNARFALRMMSRSPVFAAAVIATLALCIGANSAIFSVVDAVLFRPIPYPQPERLGSIVLETKQGRETRQQQGMDGAAWEALREARSFRLAAGGGGFGGVNLSVNNKAVHVPLHRVSAGYFSVLGVKMARGREFNAGEDRTGGPQAAVLSHRLWQTAFGAREDIVGQPILLRGEPHTVVGVVPRGFRPMVEAEVWAPLRATTSGEGSGQNFQLVARLRDGVPWEQAQSEAALLGAPALQQAWHRRQFAPRMSVRPLQEMGGQSLKDPLHVLWGAVGMVLLIGCVNVSALMMARAAARRQEMGTRLALGGGAGALLRQLGAEALLLGLLGGAAGLAVGAAGVELLKPLAERVGIWQEIRLDLRVVAATGLISVFTGLLFGLAPAWEAAHVDMRSALLDGGSRGVAGRRSHWVRNALVFVEVTLGLVLIVGAGLLVRTMAHLTSLDAGCDPRNVMTGSVSLQDARYRTAESVNRLYRDTLSRLSATPGVESAAVGLHIPFQRWLNMGVKVRTGPAASNEMLTSNFNFVTAGYFETLRIPVTQGRAFAEGDTAASAKVAVVNDAFVRAVLKGEKAVGTLLVSGKETMEIVGVVGNVRQSRSFGNFGPIDNIPAVYLPVTQVSDKAFELVHTWFSPNWIIRGVTAGPHLGAAIRSALEAADPLLPVARYTTLEGERSRALEMQSMRAWLLGSLAALALLLAAVGIYGLAANSVVERTRELTIRLALGATRSRAMWSAMRPGILLCVAGTAAGVVLSAGLVKVMAAVLFGVQPLDPATFAAGAVTLIGAGAMASLIPSLRLMRADPARLLQE